MCVKKNDVFQCTMTYRGSPHRTDFSIVRFFTNMNSSHRKVHPLYSTVFTLEKVGTILYIYKINNSSHRTNFS